MRAPKRIQIRSRGYPYLTFDTTQHRHLQFDGSLHFNVSKPVNLLEPLVQSQILMWLNTMGTPTVQVGGAHLDVQFVEIKNVKETSAGFDAELSLFFVEQMRLHGIYGSDSFTDRQLVNACQQNMNWHLVPYNQPLSGKEMPVTFGTLQLSKVNRRVELTTELKAKMEASEAGFFTWLREISQKAGAWEPLKPISDDSQSRVSKAIEMFAHHANIREEELLDFGLVPHGLKLMFQGPNGKPVMEVSGILKAENGEKVPLSYVYLHSQKVSLVVTKDIEELREMARPHFKPEAPETGMSIADIAPFEGLIFPKIDPKRD